MIYFVRDNNIEHCRMTDDKHLDDCIKYAKHDWNIDKVFVNKAVICFDGCFDGYFVNSDYIGQR